MTLKELQALAEKAKELSTPLPIYDIGGVKYYDLTDFIRNEEHMKHNETRRNNKEFLTAFFELLSHYKMTISFECDLDCDISDMSGDSMIIKNSEGELVYSIDGWEISSKNKGGDSSEE